MDMARIEPDDLVAWAAVDLGFALPETCIRGVIEALAVIAHHARIVEDAA